MTLSTPARLVAGLVFVAGLAAPVIAQPQSQISVRGAARQGLEVDARPVRFGDLDLRSTDGRRDLDTRLKVAVGTVCGKRSLWTVRPPADYTRCYDRSMSEARTQLQQRLAAGETTIRVASN